MNNWVVLLRGINVGGHNKVPMAELRKYLTERGFRDVQTYIQSGNVTLRAEDKDASRIRAAVVSLVEEQFGCSPEVMVMSDRTLANAADANPFEVSEDLGKTVHFYFLDSPAKEANMAGLQELCASTERFKLTENVFYLHAPDGIGRSKLAAGAERLLGVPVTARNLNTVRAIRLMAGVDP